MLFFVWQNRPKTVPVPIFSWPSSHYQAYVAVAGDSNGCCATVLLVGWVCEAYPNPAYAIFPQVELIQSFLREF